MDSIVYVAGIGRSGTTVIERYIAALSGGLALGETELCWSRAIIGAEPCSCGAALRDCEFWGPVFEQQEDLQDLAQRVERSRRTVRSTALSWVPVVGVYYDMHRVPAAALASDYGRAVVDLYERIGGRAGSRCVVDSSKKPVYGALLTHAVHAGVFTVHVVRDLRGYVWSMRKQRLRSKGSSERMMRSSTLMSVIRWFRGNARARRLGTMSQGYALLRYEDFAASPRDEITRVLSTCLGREPISGADHAGSSQNHNRVSSIHQIAGNPNRFGDRDLPDVRLDDEWSTAMPRWQRFVLGLLMKVFARDVGYRI